MIDEKILLKQLNIEYQKTLLDYLETGKNLYYAAELNALDAVIKIVKKQPKIKKHDNKSKFPKEVLSEWESVTNRFRR